MGSVTNTNSGYKIYPSWAVVQVAEKHGIDIGEFLYLMATHKLPKDTRDELDNLAATGKTETSVKP